MHSALGSALAADTPVSSGVTRADAGRGPLLGRAREIATLRTAMHRGWLAEPQAFVLIGEPGIGKTRTAEELARLARAEGAQVLWGRCWEGGGAPPFWAWREAMRRAGETSPPPGLAAGVIADAARLIPEIRFRHSEAALTAPHDSDLDRERGFEAVAQVLFALAAAQPLIVVLEDLQDADVPSLLLLRSILQEMRRDRHRLFVLATCRDAGQEVLFETIPRPVFDGLIALGGLAADAIATLVEDALGTSPSAASVAGLQTMTNGNPLFLREVMHLWQLRGAPSVAALEARVPHHLRVVLAEHVRYLSADCRRLMEMAAVIGTAFDTNTLEAVASSRRVFSPRQLEALLNEALRAHLIASDDPGRYRFQHALIRDFLYQGLERHERAQLHAAVGVAIETHPDRDDHLAELAHHFARAGGDDAAATSAAYASQAAEQALSSLAYEDAVRFCEGGLVALEGVDGGDVAARWRLLFTLGSARKLCGDLWLSRQAFRDAIQLAREGRSGPLFGRAVLGYLWADNSSYASPEARPLLREALQLLPVEDSPLRAELIGTLANQSLVTRNRQAKARGAELGREALAMARRCGDVGLLSRAVRDWYFTDYRPAALDERLTVTTELIGAGDATGESSIVLEGLRLRLPLQLERGDRGAFDRDVAAFAAHAQRLRQPRWLWHVHLQASMAALLAGRFGAAETEADTMMRIAQRAEEPEALHIYLAFLFSLRVLQGRLVEITDFDVTARNLVEQNPWNTAWRAGVLNGFVEVGNIEAARSGFAELAADDFARLPRDSLFLITVGFLAGLCHALDDQRRAASLYDMLVPFADRNLTQSTLFPFLGPASRYLGMLALTMGRAGDALRHFEEAVSASKRLQAEPFEILARYGISEALASRAAEGDVRRASIILGDAIARAGQMRLGLGLRAAQALRRRCFELSNGSGEAAGKSQSSAEDTTTNRFVLRLEGPYWVAGPVGGTLHLSDMRGLHFLVHLLSRPGETVPSTTLAEMTGGCGHVSARAPSDDIERLRSSVTKRLRGAIARIAEDWPEIGSHLSIAIHTGNTCSYQPSLPQTIDWIL